MIKGIDASTPCTSAASCLKQAGLEFVGRYYAVAAESWKVLTSAEAQALGAAGLRIVAVWESGSPTQASYFSHAQGVQDGQGARAQALALGQPAGTPVYFAVDYDAAASDISGVITQYFEGLQAAFGTGGAPFYAVGVYGSGAVCQAMLAAGLASRAWLAESTGWSGSSSFTGWNIKQSATIQPVCGISVDNDVAEGDYGGFNV